MIPPVFTQYLEKINFTSNNPSFIPKMFQRTKFTLVEKTDFVIAFFTILTLILALLSIITVLLLIITALQFVSLLSIRYEGIIDILLNCMCIGLIFIIGLYTSYQLRMWSWW